MKNDDETLLKIMSADCEYTIVFYRKCNGKIPAAEFLKLQNSKMRAKILRDILELGNKGPELEFPHSRKLDDEIYELRTKQGSDIYRLLYFFEKGKKIVFTNGFVKKSTKTPKGEIVKTRNAYKDYYNL